MGITRKKNVGLAVVDGDTYPPKSWTCPYCDRHHSKPHFAHPGQVDYTKEPAEVGRVIFNREDPQSACDSYKDDTKRKKEYEGKTGPDRDAAGIPTPLFCPHCGYIGEIVVLIKKAW